MTYTFRAVVIKDDISKLSAEARSFVGQEIEDACLRIEAKAKMRSRVDTGALQASWTGRLVGPTTGVVFSDQEHSIYNEFGTRFMSAQPMLRPSAQEELPKLMKAIKQHIEQEAK